MKKNFKLDVELVPRTSWYDNLRSVIPRSLWDKLRKETYAKYGNRCGVCGVAGKLNCHEIWGYDDIKHVQRLTGFIALCDMCHHIKHIGLAGILAEEGKLDINAVIDHFIKVNEETYDIYIDEVFNEWEERSNHKWSVELGEYQNLVDQNMIDIKNAKVHKTELPSIYDELTRSIEERYVKPNQVVVDRINGLKANGNIIETDDEYVYIFVCDRCGYKWTHKSTGNETLLEAFNNCPSCSGK